MTEESFPEAVREVVRDELGGVSICTFAVVKSVSHTDQRVSIELVNDPGYVDGDVPVVAPGTADVPGVTPGDEVVVIFTADAVTEMTARPGTVPEAGRDGSHTSAIALPLHPYNASESVPDHEPGERVLAHDNGAMVRFGPNGEPDLRVDHPSGVELSVDSEQAPDGTGDGFGTGVFGSGAFGDRPPGQRESPPRHAGVAEVSHPSGVGVTVGKHGVSLNTGDADSASGPTGGYGYEGFDAGEYDGGGESPQGVTTTGKQNDPWRVEVAGSPDRPEEGHRHELPDERREMATVQVSASGDGSTTSFTLTHDLGVEPESVDVSPASQAAAGEWWVSDSTAETVTVSYASAPASGTENLSWEVTAVGPVTEETLLTGVPATQRELFEWLCARVSELANSDHAAIEDAETFYTNWLEWLEEQTGESLDPTIGDGDVGTEWPYPEPVPDPTDRELFSPSRSRD